MKGFDGGGFAVGEVYGARWWNLRDAGGTPTLRGAYSYDWTAGDNTARCSYGKHRVPSEKCGCGFWGYWVPEAAPIAAKPRVMGIIKGWGDDTLIGDKGFRCGQAKIVALCCEDMAQRVVQGGELTYVAGPPENVRMRDPYGFMQTFRAFGGQGTYRPDPDAPAKVEADYLKQAQIEYLLGERYQCPVYTTFDGMMAMHPTTKDYLPPPPPPPLPPWHEELARMGMADPANYTQAAKMLGDLMAEFTTNLNKIGEAVISGNEAMRRLLLIADFSVELSGSFTLSDEEINKMLGLPPG